MKKIILMALTLALALGGTVYAAESASDSEAVETVRALGIMIGDENGNLNLANNVTRAEFAKMLVAASKYKDSISSDGTGYSLYSDVKSNYWGSEYIRIAAGEGWMIGYTDGSFRPNNNITLEETLAATLRLLGYSSEDLAGSFPYAQLNKASAIGLRDEISREKGELMLRSDCAKLFYNALSAENGQGQVYGQTLGYKLTSDGKVDFNDVLLENLSGPYVAAGGEKLSFNPIAIYKDGEAVRSSALEKYDVYYYNEAMRALWIYTDKASGKIDALSPSVSAPTSLTLSGKTYQIGSANATYKLSALGGNAEGNTVTLLLGMNGEVVDVVGGGSGSELSMSYYGVVLSSEKTAGDDKTASVHTYISLLCTDGETRTFSIEGSGSFKAGDLAVVHIDGGEYSASTLSEKSLSGKVAADGTSIGSRSLAAGANILDTAGKNETSAVTIKASELAGLALSNSEVRYYAENAKGEISDMILNNVSGDAWEYGYMTDTAVSGAGFNQTGSYTYAAGGKTQTYRATGTTFSIAKGGFGFYRGSDNQIAAMKQLSSVSIDRISSLSAYSGTRSHALSDDAEVYLKQGSDYYSSDLSAVNASDYKLTGWIDSFSGSGGKVRIIIAEKK